MRDFLTIRLLAPDEAIADIVALSEEGEPEFIGQLGFDSTKRTVRMWRFPSCAAADRFHARCEQLGLASWESIDLGGLIDPPERRLP